MSDCFDANYKAAYIFGGFHFHARGEGACMVRRIIFCIIQRETFQGLSLTLQTKHSILSV